MTHVCLQCGTAAKPRTITKGSILIELVLWLCFLVPGFIYSLWRLTTRHKACGCCGSRAIVPVTSPAGQKAVRPSREPARDSLLPRDSWGCR